MKIVLPENYAADRKKERVAVRLKKKGTLALRKGHPWIFEDSIERISREGRAGNVAVLFDASGKNLLGAGLFDPESTVRVKTLAFGSRTLPVGPLLFAESIRKALDLRIPFLPEETNAWRVIHGESDGFSGIVVDKYEETLVVKVYSSAWLVWLDDLIRMLSEMLPETRRCVVRLSREVNAALESDCPFTDGSVFLAEGEAPFDGHLVFREHGIRFSADVIRGQKTGFFLDQRDNRYRVSLLTRGKRVLNVFSYSGGFSLYAAKGGASYVVSEDINKHAIECVNENFSLNQDCREIAACRHEEIAADAFAAMERLRADHVFFDLVIVDPPSFAKAESEVRTALNTYSRLAKAAVRLLVPNGILVFASCSSRVSSDRLFEVVHETASAVGRPLKELERTGHAVDHPAKFKESAYLKCMYALVMEGKGRV